MPTSDSTVHRVVLARLWPGFQYRVALLCSCDYSARGGCWAEAGRLMDEHLEEVLRGSWGETDKET